MHIPLNKGFWIFVLTVMLTLQAPLVQAAEYKIDADHSSVTFKIRHLLSKTQGRFSAFSGNFTFEEGKPETWKVSASIDAASIDTNVAERDNHLRSADFFNVEKFPTLTFESTKIENVTAESAELHGNLTLHGVTKPVVLDLEIYGVAEDAWGIVRSAFSATTKINRTDFGLQWNETLETGKLLVGEEVQITLEIEGILKK